MSWQDELRRLDAELATGKISLHDHRKQRDELLAAASGGFTPSPVASPLSPPQWPTEPPPEPTPNASAALLASDRPTSAPSPADERPTDSMRYPSFEDAPTVITRAVRPGGPLPTLTPQYPAAPPGGPTVPMRRARRGPTWVFLTFGVLIVLVLVVGASWYFGVHNNNPTATSPTAPVNPTDAVSVAEAKLPTLPGAASPNNSTMSIDKAVQLQLISQADAGVMEAGGAQEIVVRASADPANTPNGNMLLAVPASSAVEASKLVATLRKNLTDNGFTPLPLGPANADLAFSGSNPGGRVSALWYTTGPLAIGIGVSQPLNGNPAQLRSRLEQIHAQVTGALPAG